MEPKISEIAQRIRELRSILNLSVEEAAAAVGISAEEYKNYESGESDFPFTFLYKCAERFGVDMVELLTGENPRLTGYTVVRGGQGLPIKRREGFEYSLLAHSFKNKTAEPFLVRAPYRQSEQSKPVEMNVHEGQEFDYVLEGCMRFVFEGHEELLMPGDSVYFDSGREHGMIATGGKDCLFLAIVMKNDGDTAAKN
ncbi:MAG: cupin domain-containing protein [Clostridiales bacterium]|nr:cupin domain-containing protein [Clostridiales bacterium]